MGHHLAVLYRTYVNQIIRGRKTVECRIGQLGYPPHGVVQPGDLVWIKEVSGPVRAVVAVQGVRGIPLAQAGALAVVREEWNDRILAPASFWRVSPRATIATLIELGEVCALRPFRILKSDRRAWVPLSRPPVPGQLLCTLRVTAAARR